MAARFIRIAFAWPRNRTLAAWPPLARPIVPSMGQLLTTTPSPSRTYTNSSASPVQQQDQVDFFEQDDIEMDDSVDGVAVEDTRVSETISITNPSDPRTSQKRPRSIKSLNKQLATRSKYELLESDLEEMFVRGE